jgi:hypothetical protein
MTVNCEYNTATSTLTFTKDKDTEDKFEMKVIAADKGQCYRPCVWLCEKGDKVEVG